MTTQTEGRGAPTTRQKVGIVVPYLYTIPNLERPQSPAREEVCQQGNGVYRGLVGYVCSKAREPVQRGGVVSSALGITQTHVGTQKPPEVMPHDSYTSHGPSQHHLQRDLPRDLVNGSSHQLGLWFPDHGLVQATARH